MLIIPAIDILDNRLVRLTRGDYQQVTEYGLSPLEVLRNYASAGARRIHLVFLGAAREGLRLSEEEPLLLNLLEEKERLGLQIEIGGGIRTVEEVKRLLRLGADYAILGTAAILDAIKIGEERVRMAYRKSLASFVAEVDLPSPGILQEIIRQKLPEKIIISLDCKRGTVAVSGWEVTLPPRPEALVRDFQEMGLHRIIYTSVQQDGTLLGPDTAGIKRLSQSAPEVSFVAAGGIGSYEDIAGLARLNLANLEGVIIGKALYEGRIDLRKVIAQFQ